jgi:hypothetical protein
MMAWFYNSHSGAILEEAGITGFLEQLRTHLGLGWHGPFKTEQDAVNFAASIHGPKPTTNLAQGLGNVAGQAAGPVVSAAGDALKSLNPLAGLFQANIWLRVAEVIVGLVLLGIGLNSMLKGAPLKAVTGPAGALARVVP